jgi:hypothetical protein
MFSILNETKIEKLSYINIIHLELVNNLFNKMVRSETTTPNTLSIIRDLEERRISISSDFQRGDEETGVWSEKMNITFIDSRMKGYGIGLITFVRYVDEEIWSVLDGGNRCRALRDFYNGVFKWDGKKYGELSGDERGKLDYMTMPCEKLTIEPGDPPDTIAEMFTRLNTSSKTLSAGELCKAHGYRRNILEIEVAKKIVGGDAWTNSSVTDARIDAIRVRWVSIMGEITEGNRCESLKTIIGYIMSAILKKLKVFSPTDAYKKWKNDFTIIGDFSNMDDTANEKIDKIRVTISKLMKTPVKFQKWMTLHDKESTGLLPRLSFTNLVQKILKKLQKRNQRNQRKKDWKTVQKMMLLLIVLVILLTVVLFFG